MLPLLNYTISGEGNPILLIHGLFGNLDNLGLLARDLSQDHQVISIDLRNHGLSFHCDEHNYPAMADDIDRLVKHLDLPSFVIIGHSMGGKAAMRYAADHPENLDKLIVLDMAPIAYPARRHDTVFAGLKAVLEQKPTRRRQAMEILAAHIEMDSVRQFLGKSLYNTGDHLTWRFNVPALWNHYDTILGWDPVPTCDLPTLFMKGANSEYLLPEYQTELQKQFSHAKAHVIANAGHWLHAEKPQEVLRTIRRFL